MPRFSERMGFRPVKSVIQADSVDNNLRYSLWNVVTRVYWKFAAVLWTNDEFAIKPTLPVLLWQDYFKLPLDDMPDTWHDFHREMKQHFMGCEWHGVYDFIEFLAGVEDITPYFEGRHYFMMECNRVLEQEMSAYRFVDGKIVALTTEQEIAAIETAVATAKASEPLRPVAIHLRQALEALADRKAPDCRTSMKESISAVEAICKLIAGDDRTTLGAALKRIESSGTVSLHHNLKEAFTHLYWYTSDAEGIRHALKGEPTADVEDALFMLVSCSAFVNYLVAKADKAGIALSLKAQPSPAHSRNDEAREVEVQSNDSKLVEELAAGLQAMFDEDAKSN